MGCKVRPGLKASKGNPEKKANPASVVPLELAALAVLLAALPCW